MDEKLNLCFLNLQLGDPARNLCYCACFRVEKHARFLCLLKIKPMLDYITMELEVSLDLLTLEAGDSVMSLCSQI